MLYAELVAKEKLLYLKIIFQITHQLSSTSSKEYPVKLFSSNIFLNFSDTKYLNSKSFRRKISKWIIFLWSNINFVIPEILPLTFGLGKSSLKRVYLDLSWSSASIKFVKLAIEKPSIWELSDNNIVIFKKLLITFYD